MGYREQLEAGHGAFAAMLKAWHERNSWSHRVLPALAEQLDFGRLHSSQLSNLRNRKLASPGPEVFLALGSCNRWLAEAAKGGDALEQLEGQEELLAALKISALPLLDASGAPLKAGELPFAIYAVMRWKPSKKMKKKAACLKMKDVVLRVRFKS